MLNKIYLHMIRPLLLTVLLALFVSAVNGQHKSAVVSDSLKAKVSNEKFEKVDKSAEFPGGLRKFYEYMNQHLNYPKAEGKENVYGKLYVEFVVGASGAIDDESVRVIPANEVLKSTEPLGSDIITDKAYESEAIRVLRECPDWKPALLKDNPVRQKLVIPIIFRR
jgi:periplasmic protein TonB